MMTTGNTAASAPAPVLRGTLPAGTSLRVLALLAFRLAFQGKRAIVVGLFLAAPVLLAFAWKTVVPVPRGLGSADDFLMSLGLMAYASGLVPLVCLLFGTSVVSDEWEGKTLTYLFTRPVKKHWVVLGKALGMWIVTVLLVGVSFALTAWLLWSKRLPTDFQKHPELAFSLFGIIALSTLPYTAFFVFLGCVLRRPLIPGLLFAFGLEKVLSFVPASVQGLTFHHYVRALMLPYSDVSGLLRELNRSILSRVDQPGAIESIAWLVAFTVSFAALSAWTIGKREFVLTKGE